MPYQYPEVASLEDTPLVGSHQCVALVQHYAGAPGPAATTWNEGERVLDATNVPVGTAIATFVNGHYQSHRHGNHAALFMGREGNCIRVMDQWAGDPTKPTVSSRVICPMGKYRNGDFRDPSNNADAFFIIE